MNNKLPQSKYTGVHWHTKARCWQASIYWFGQTRHLGFFTNQSKAYSAYVKAKKEKAKYPAKQKKPANKNIVKGKSVIYWQKQHFRGQRFKHNQVIEVYQHNPCHRIAGNSFKFLRKFADKDTGAIGIEAVDRHGYIRRLAVKDYFFISSLKT